MADGTKRVFYVKYLAHNIFTEILGRRSDIRLDKLENDSPDDAATPVLAGAHAFQIGSARDELAKKYHAGPRPAAPHAEPADRLDQRRRLRHREPERLHRRRRAGGQPGRRQQGGGRRARARHDAEPDQAHRREPTARCGARRISTATLYIGHDLSAQTVGIVGLGNVGKRLARTVPRAVLDAGALLRPLCVGRGDDGSTASRRSSSTTLMREADFVSINCPLTDETRGMIGASAIRADEAERLFRHDRARQHPRRGGARGGAAREEDRRRRPRRVGEGAAAARPSAAAVTTT